MSSSTLKIVEEDDLAGNLLNQALRKLSKQEQIQIVTAGVNNSKTAEDAEKYLVALELLLFCCC